MYLSKHDLLQMNDEWLEELPAEHLLKVSKRLLHDVKVLQDRQNQTPNNSSRPPGSQAPWERSASSSEATQETEAEAAEDDASEAKAAPKEAYTRESAPGTKGKKSEKKPGKQPGSPGYGRTQKLMVTDTCEHHPEVCAVCGSAISVGSGVLAYTAWDEIDIAPLVEGEIGLRLSVTRHLLHEGMCVVRPRYPSADVAGAGRWTVGQGGSGPMASGGTTLGWNDRVVVTAHAPVTSTHPRAPGRDVRPVLEYRRD